MINWSTNKEETALIRQIAERAMGLELGEDFIDVAMDITACHCNGCRLDLPALLDADEDDFTADVCGIRDYIDHRTGKLTDGFWPEFAEEV